MDMKGVQEIGIKINKVCDYIPVVSTGTNIIALVIKVALQVFEFVEASFYNDLVAQPLLKSYKEKSFGTCIALCIPIINVAAAFENDFPTKTLKERRLEQEQFIRDLQETNQGIENLKEEINRLKTPVAPTHPKIAEYEKLIEEERKKIATTGDTSLKIAYAKQILWLQDQLSIERQAAAF